MKNALRLYLHIIGVLLSSSLAQAGALLFASYDGSAVKLQWHPTTWAADEAGFVLKRRTVKANTTTPWKPLHTGVLLPSVDYTRDWTLLGFNKQQTVSINENIELKKYNTGKTLSADALGAILRKNKAFDPVITIGMMRDAANAFAYGLGYIDNTVKSGNNYEYGLFEVSESGMQSPEPVAVRKPFNIDQRKDWAKLTELEISPRVQPETLNMRWRMKVSQAQAMAVAYFIVERRGETETTWHVVSEETPYSLYKSKSEARWVIKDKVTPALPKPPIHYRLTPVDMFQNKLPAVDYVINSLDADPTDSSLYGPSTLSAKIENDKLHVTWAQNATKWRGDSIYGFRLKSNEGSGKKFPLWLNPAREAEIDLSELVPIKKIKLEAVYIDWDDYESRVESMDFINLDVLR
jgi:hypothetical protein